jgi:hypothetical protein
MRRSANGGSEPLNRCLSPKQLAYAFGKLKQNDLFGVLTGAEKMLMLAALNMVECIAEVAPRLTR